MARRALVALWIVVGVAVWNGFFDLYVSRGEREYLQKRAEFDAGLGLEPEMAVVMSEARRAGVIAATIWAVLVVGLGGVTVYVLAHPPAGHSATSSRERPSS